MSGANKSVRCLIFGQQSIGKTSFILKYLGLPIEHKNTLGKASFVKTELIDDEIVCLTIEKISSEDELTSNEISKSDVCVLAFSVNDPISFAYIIRARSIIYRCKPDLPIIIVATKADLRNSTLVGVPCIDMIRVHTFASEIGAYAYFETSIFSVDETSLLFCQAIKIVKLVEDCNERMKLQMDSTFQRIFSTVKNIWNRANNVVRQQTIDILGTKDIEEAKECIEEDKLEKVEPTTKTEENTTKVEDVDDEMTLLSNISILNIKDIIDEEDNSNNNSSYV
uniref:Ras family protein n=1 Tax=Parastrongyloides trichosuri TaxID=131310 RepID=A0A0N4ZF38_PARTI